MTTPPLKIRQKVDSVLRRFIVQEIQTFRECQPWRYAKNSRKLKNKNVKRNQGKNQNVQQHQNQLHVLKHRWKRQTLSPGLEIKNRSPLQKTQKKLRTPQNSHQLKFNHQLVRQKIEKKGYNLQIVKSWQQNEWLPQFVPQSIERRIITWRSSAKEGREGGAHHHALRGEAESHHRRIQKETKSGIHKKDEEKYKKQSWLHRSRYIQPKSLRTTHQTQHRSAKCQKIASSGIQQIKLSFVLSWFLFSLTPFPKPLPYFKTPCFLTHTPGSRSGKKVERIWI